MSFLVKAEAVQGALGWLLTNVGQYALDRDVPDREPLLQALAQLKAGGAIGIFPEGTRGSGNVDYRVPGAGWLAVPVGAPVVPVAMRGTARPRGAPAPAVPSAGARAGREPFPVPIGGAGQNGGRRRRTERDPAAPVRAGAASWTSAVVADRRPVGASSPGTASS